MQGNRFTDTHAEDRRQNAGTKTLMGIVNALQCGRPLHIRQQVTQVVQPGGQLEFSACVGAPGQGSALPAVLQLRDPLTVVCKPASVTVQRQNVLRVCAQ
jgi:hypothetical protein